MSALESLESRRDPSSFRRDPLPLPAGNSFVRLLTANALASMHRTMAVEIVARLWPSDRIIARAVAPPAMTTVSGWAAELSHKLVADALDALSPLAAGPDLLRRGLVLNFDRYGIISVPAIVASAANSGFVAEGDPIPVRQLTTTGAQLLPYKLGSIAVLTREMVESSNAEQLIGDALLRAAALALDTALFDSNAATTARPAGLRNGIATSTASNSSDPFGAVFEDVTTLVNAVEPVAGDGGIALVCSAGRALMIRARFSQDINDPALPIFASPAVGNDLVAVALDALASAFSPDPEVETSNAATLHMNDAPAPIAPSGGTMSAPARSLFQTEALAIKIRWPVSWVLRDSRGVAWLTPTWK